MIQLTGTLNKSHPYLCGSMNIIPKGEKGNKGDSYIITEADYEAIAKKVTSQLKTSDLENDAKFISEIMVNGKPVENEDGSIDLKIVLGEEIVCGQGFGGIKAGTIIPADTPLEDILKQLLNTEEVEESISLEKIQSLFNKKEI